MTDKTTQDEIRKLDSLERRTKDPEKKAAVGLLLNTVRQWDAETDYKKKLELVASIKRQREVVRGLGVEV